MALTRLSPDSGVGWPRVLLPLSSSLSHVSSPSPSLCRRLAIAIIYFNYFFASVVSGCSYNLTASQIAHEMLLEYFVAMLAIMGLTTTFDKRSLRQLQPFGKYA